MTLWNKLVKKINHVILRVWYAITYPYMFLYMLYAVCYSYELDIVYGYWYYDGDSAGDMIERKGEQVLNFCKKHFYLPYIVTVR